MSKTNNTKPDGIYADLEDSIFEGEFVGDEDRSRNVITIPNSSTRGRPGLTPESRQNQLIALAMDMAEEQLRNRTASSQVLTTVLKLGTVQAQLELEKTKRDIKLAEVKADAFESTKRLEEMFNEALKAFKIYEGQGSSNE